MTHQQTLKTQPHNSRTTRKYTLWPIQRLITLKLQNGKKKTQLTTANLKQFKHNQEGTLIIEDLKEPKPWIL